MKANWRGCIMQTVVTRAALAALLFLGIIGSQVGYGLNTAQAAGKDSPVTRVETGYCESDQTFTIVIHGGVAWGGIHASKLPVMKQILSDARSALSSGARAIDVVEAVIAEMENSGLFNAGKAAIANQAGVMELDASIMDGRDLQAGAVAAVKTVRNPIIAARLVMDKSEHVMMVGPNADRFIKQNGGAIVDASYYLHGGQNFSDVALPDDMSITAADDDIRPERAGYLGIWGGVFLGNNNAILVVEKIERDKAQVIYAFGNNTFWGKPFYRRLPGVFVDGALQIMEPAEFGGYKITYRLNPDDTILMRATHPDLPDAEGMMKRLPSRPGGDNKSGTVGAAVRDRCGDLAAGTSTGGFDSKIPGRVGDSPIIGAGTYADNETAAISATGHGEFFMRHVVAYDITAGMKYKGLSVKQAATNLIKKELRIKGLRGGVIAVDRDGNFVMTYNTKGMVRGVTTNTLEPTVKVY
jgi:isoaspartyl peptidase/L-asparaginase-like protein (Ntn-hydrolase superfamily)